MFSLIRALTVSGLFWCLGGCAMLSSDSSKSREDIGAHKEKSGIGRQNSGVQRADHGVYTGGKSLVLSLENNKMTSRIIDRSRAGAVTQRFSKLVKGNRQQIEQQYEDLIAAERMAGVSVERLLSHLKSLGTASVTGKVRKRISEKARLEVALAALEQGRHSLALFLLEGLITATNRRIRAGAYNALGVIALEDGRTPEAAELWKRALKEASGYHAAILNLGFINLKFGHFATARQYLSMISGDWFARSGLLVASRLTNRSGDTANYCAELLRTKPSDKAIAFNCGIHEWQSNSNLKMARKLISQALNLRGGPPSWEESGYRILEQMP